MTVETPQPRDRVRWQRTRAIEGVVEEITADGIVVRDGDGYKHLCQVDDVTVEVLERADDPSKDLPGAIRREDVGGNQHLWQALVIPSDPRRTRWVCIHAPGSSLAVGKLKDHHEVERFPVFGSAFGTPAWEQESTEIAPPSRDW